MPKTLSTFTRMLAKTMRPLSKAEAKLAIGTALEHLRPELERDGESRFRALGAQLTATRPRDKGIPRRLIEIIVVDYSNRRHLNVVVSGKRVVEVRPLGFQPAFSQEELAEADGIARKDKVLRAALRGRSIFVSAYAPGSMTPDQRRIGLRWLRSEKRGPASCSGQRKSTYRSRGCLGPWWPAKDGESWQTSVTTIW
jgi:hypothetical protein